MGVSSSVSIVEDAYVNLSSPGCLDFSLSLNKQARQKQGFVSDRGVITARSNGPGVTGYFFCFTSLGQKWGTKFFLERMLNLRDLGVSMTLGDSSVSQFS